VEGFIDKGIFVMFDCLCNLIVVDALVKYFEGLLPASLLIAKLKGINLKFLSYNCTVYHLY
jgi:hypothetical protein